MPSPANTAPSVIFDLSVQYPVSLGCRALSSGCGVRALELNIEGLGFSAFSMGTFGLYARSKVGNRTGRPSGLRNFASQRFTHLAFQTFWFNVPAKLWCFYNRHTFFASRLLALALQNEFLLKRHR